MVGVHLGSRSPREAMPFGCNRDPHLPGDTNVSLLTPQCVRCSRDPPCCVPISIQRYLGCSEDSGAPPGCGVQNGAPLGTPFPGCMPVRVAGQDMGCNRELNFLQTGTGQMQ